MAKGTTNRRGKPGQEPGRKPWAESAPAAAPPRAKPPARAANKRDGMPGQIAREMWVELGGTEAQTCEAAGITPTTLRRWRDWFGWDEERKANVFSWGGLIADIRKRIGEVRTDLQEAASGDVARIFELTKALRELISIVQAVRQMERDVDFKRLSLRWSKRFADHLGERDPEALQALLPHLRSFTTEIVREQL